MLRRQSDPSLENQDAKEESHRIWMRDYWDRYIRDERHFQAILLPVSN